MSRIFNKEKFCKANQYSFLLRKYVNEVHTLYSIFCPIKVRNFVRKNHSKIKFHNDKQQRSK